MSTNGDTTWSRSDRTTMLVAVIALLLSGVATYVEFFHNPTRLTALISNVGAVGGADSLRVDVRVYLLNAGSHEALLQGGYPFLSVDGSQPGGYWQSTPNDRFWWGDQIDEPIIVEPGRIETIVFSLRLDNEALRAFGADGWDGTSERELRVGVSLSALSVNARRRLRQEIVGTLVLRESGFTVQPQGSTIDIF